MKGKVMKLARQTITSIEEITNVTFDSIPQNKIEITGLDRARVTKKTFGQFFNGRFVLKFSGRNITHTEIS